MICLQKSLSNNGCAHKYQDILVKMHVNDRFVYIKLFVYRRVSNNGYAHKYPKSILVDTHMNYTCPVAY